MATLQRITSYSAAEDKVTIMHIFAVILCLGVNGIKGRLLL